jgi:hypothetical protein
MDGSGGPPRRVPGHPAHPQAGAITAITIERIAGDKVVECWTNADDLGMRRLLGVVPEMG